MSICMNMNEKLETDMFLREPNTENLEIDARRILITIEYG